MFINKLACHKLASIAFSTKKLPNFHNNQSLQRAFSCIVGHSTNLTTVHSWVIVGSCSMEYEYKLLRQLTTTVCRCHLCLEQSQSNSGHTKWFCSYLRIEQSGSSWKASRYLKSGYQVTFANNGEQENKFSEDFYAARACTKGLSNWFCPPVSLSVRWKNFGIWI